MNHLFVATWCTLLFNVFGHVAHPLKSSWGARLKPKCLNTSNKGAVTRKTGWPRKSLRASKHCQHSVFGTAEGCTCEVSTCITASIKRRVRGTSFYVLHPRLKLIPTWAFSVDASVHIRTSVLVICDLFIYLFLVLKTDLSNTLLILTVTFNSKPGGQLNDAFISTWKEVENRALFPLTLSRTYNMHGHYLQPEIMWASDVALGT